MAPDSHTSSVGPNPSPGQRGLQPIKVTLGDVAEFADIPEAKRLARLQADTDLMLRISVEGFEGKAYRKLVFALAEYGFAVIRAWVVTGRILAKGRSKGFQGYTDRLGTPVSRDDALDVCRDTVASALNHFRRNVLEKGMWNPQHGASLATFFINNCLMRYPTEYRRWKRSYDDQVVYLRNVGQFDPMEVDHPAFLKAALDDPATDVVDFHTSTQRVAELLRPIRKEQNRMLLKLVADGASIEDVAIVLGISEKAVESRLYRIRSLYR